MRRIAVRRTDSCGTLVDNGGKPLARQIQWSVEVDGIEISNHDTRTQARAEARRLRAEEVSRV